MKVSVDVKTSERISHFKGESPDGMFGSYVRAGKKRGIKILYGSYDRLEALKHSDEYKAACKEAALLRLIRHRGFKGVPKCYGVIVICRKRSLGNRPYYNVGIVMQHLGSTRLADAIPSADRDHPIANRLRMKMEKFGIYHGDLHANNIMVYKGRYYAIDFSFSAISRMHWKILKAA